MVNRPDWLWNSDAGIDRTYSAPNMGDVSEALDEVRDYIKTLEGVEHPSECPSCGEVLPHPEDDNGADIRSFNMDIA